MTTSAPNPYLKTKILTATPEELRLMLYEGAVRFCRQAIPHLDNKDFEASYNALMRAQKIVLELSTSLNHQIAPELCDKLNALYIYIYKLLIDANVKQEKAPIEEAIQLLEYEKETWQLLMAKLAQETGKTGGNARIAPTPTQQTAISSLSTNG